MFVFNLSTKPVFHGFAPLYWAFDEKRPKTEKPTHENFKACYERRCSEDKKPGPVEKRLVMEFLGGLGIIGGLAAWGYGKFRNSNIVKKIGGALGITGAISTIVGLIKFYVTDLDSILGIKEKKNSGTPDPNAGTGMIVSDSKEPNPQDLKPATLAEQAKRVWDGFVHHSLFQMSQHDEIINHPIFQKLVTFIPGGAVAMQMFEGSRNALDVYKQYMEGNLNLETDEGKKYSSLNAIEKEAEYIKVLGLQKGEESDIDTIAKKYRKLARQFHPDANRDKSDEEQESLAKQFCKITEAYDHFEKKLRKPV